MTGDLSYASILGYRRSRRNFLGMQARLVTIGDGVLRVVDRSGAEQERVEVDRARVQLRRGLVEIAAGDRRFFLFGYSDLNRTPPELRELLDRERATIRGRAPGLVLGAAAASRQLFDVLVAGGAERAG